MEASLNGLPIIEGEIHEPLRGAWTARVEVDDDVGSIQGPARLVVGGVLFQGVAEGEASDGRFVARIVGGRGALKTQLDARYYYQARLRTVVDDILRAAGEQLDPDEPHLALNERFVQRWARLRGDARLALSEVAKALGGFWRVSRAGGVVLRVEDPWTDVGKVLEVARDDAAKSATIAPESAPVARPGTLVNGRRVVDVVTTFDAQELRQKVAYEDPRRARSAGAGIMEAAARATEAARAYSQWYPARVIAQAADGSLELYPDDETIRGNGLTHVPLRHGLPGCTVELGEGARVLLFFEGGAPTAPAAALFPGDAGVRAIRLHVGELLELGGDGARFPSVAELVDAEFAKIERTLGSLSGASFVTPYKRGGSTAASKVKVE